MSVCGHGCKYGRGGGGGIFVGECGGELGGVVVGVCVGLDVGVGIRVPVVPGARVGGPVPFCGVNIAPSVTGMAAGGGFLALVVWSSQSPPRAEFFLDPPGPRSARRST